VQREQDRRGVVLNVTGAIERLLRDLRILIVHAGGDSRRLPAYGPCGKIFVPLPSGSWTELPPALFDRLAPLFLALPPGAAGRGQILVAAGDALILFDATNVTFSHPGLTALGCLAKPEEATRHGVFCLGIDGAVALYLQKPSLEMQGAAGAIGTDGRTPLDIGVMHLDAATAVALLAAFGAVIGADGLLDFPDPARSRILHYGLDLYREICCAIGRAASLEHYVRSARASGSRWSAGMLAEVYPALSRLPFHAELVPRCRFLHFGSTRQLIESGLALVAEDRGRPPASTVVAVNNELAANGQISGADSWVEGCRIASTLHVAGQNVIAGVNVDAPLSLPREACLDVLCGSSRSGDRVWFVRCYGAHDTFKHFVAAGALFCGRPVLQWLSEAGADPDEVWSAVPDPAHRSLWNARVFPAVREAADFRRWLWMWAPQSASNAERRSFQAAERYSPAEIALLADQAAFHSRRSEIWRSVCSGPGARPCAPA
jgi:fucokinase